MYLPTSDIVTKANRLVRLCESRDPYTIADCLGVHIVPCNFQRQRGAYKVIKRERFVFLNDNLDDISKRIVLLHELGHDTLHRLEAARTGGFKEFELFNMMDNRMEYEANVFASQVALSDEEFLELCNEEYDVQQIAMATRSDINLVALKADTMISQGYRLRKQDHSSDFLRYDK